MGRQIKVQDEMVGHWELSRHNPKGMKEFARHGRKRNNFVLKCFFCLLPGAQWRPEKYHMADRYWQSLTRGAQPSMSFSTLPSNAKDANDDKRLSPIEVTS